jgi:hypothetical protein
MTQLIDPGCIPCRLKKQLLNQQYDAIYNTTKQRALDSGINHAIYYDEEDGKFRATELQTTIERGVERYEIVTPH